MPIKIEKFTDYKDQYCWIGKLCWNVPRLITLSADLEPFEIPMKCLNIYTSYDSMSLRTLVGHMMSVQEADLKYPIILDEDGDILDGRHRIMKALLLGKESILAVRFESNPEPDSVEE